MRHFTVISNPNSTNNNRNLQRLSRKLAGKSGIDHYVLKDFKELPDIVARGLARKTDALIINGGDGTVQAVLTILMGDAHRGKDLPVLGILPGGRTNMTADDINRSRRQSRAVRRLLDLAADDRLALSVVKRSVIKLTNGLNQPPVYGMFFGTAAVVRCIEYCRQRLYPLGLPNSIAHALVFIMILLNVFVNSGRRSKRFPADFIDVVFDEHEKLQGNFLLSGATTLNRLLLGLAPVGGVGNGVLRYISVDYSAQAVLSLLSPLLRRGRVDSTPFGMTCRNAGRITFTMECPYTLDGELYYPAHDGPLVLEDAGELDFVSL